MPAPDIVSLILRWFHVLGAATMIGGSVFIWVALLPSLIEIDETSRAKLHAAVRSRWSKVVMSAIGVLLLTGLVNFIIANRTYEFHGTPYHMLFGVKFLIAMVIFFIASLLTGRSGLSEKIRQNARLWLGLNLILVFIVVGLSGTLRATRERAKPKEPAKTALCNPAQVQIS